ncbi:glycosyl hydrolase [Actinoplanes sp. NPDC051861]|uniref:glycoside hydrolase family 26 protein n=1 Tax=Actinoplanes sp. NPDC051861 TaxID=3155170 RepID=UPI00343AEBB7
MPAAGRMIVDLAGLSTGVRVELGRLSRRYVLSVGALGLVAACAPDAPPPSFSPEVETPRATAAPSTSSAPVVVRGGPVPFTPGRAMLGSYSALGGKSLTQSLALRRKQLGREQRIVHRFYPWDGFVPTSEPEVAKSSILMVSWHGAPLAAITGGSADGLIRSVARKLKGMRRPILLRWAWEMNGDWFEWGGSPELYVKAYRRIHRVFGDVGADNVAWVWSPNWNSSPDTPANRIAKYYPGDSYVDWVGVSGYNFFGESPSTLFSRVIDLYGNRKPVILSETAAVSDKAGYIKKLCKWVDRTPSVGAVVWFDTDIQDGTTNNFRFDTDAAALSAYREMARSRRFSG